MNWLCQKTLKSPGIRSKKMDYKTLILAKSAIERGENISLFLKNLKGVSHNSNQIIELSYDLQSGNYINFIKDNFTIVEEFVEEFSEHCDKHLSNYCSLLDVGTGECTTVTALCNKLTFSVSNLFAFDISWSRVNLGQKYWSENIIDKETKFHPFVAEMGAIPLPSKSVDFSTSSGAFESNGSNLSSLLVELFRVTRDKCILFEPSYENNSSEGKARMDKLGYIKDLPGHIKNAGGILESVSLMKTQVNPLNPTACYVISPPEVCTKPQEEKKNFSLPGTDFEIFKKENFYISLDTGIAFPILRKVPILKNSSGILATGFTQA